MAVALTAWAMAGAAEDPAAGDAAVDMLNQIERLSAAGLTEAIPGQWVLYSMGGTSQPSYVRVGVLGHEQTPDGPGTWMEVTYGNQPEGGIVAMKYLSVGSGSDAREMVRAVIRFAGGAPLELTPGQLARMRKKAKHAPLEALPTHERERKMTAAGVFDCERFDLRVGTIWVSPQAPLFHLVQASFQGVRVDLAGFGQGAKDWVGEPRGRIAPLPDGGYNMYVIDGGAPAPSGGKP